MNTQLEERTKNVLANVFDIDPSTISEETSQDTVEKWNSLGHMNLVIALEEEFNIQFNEQQTSEIISYPLIILVLKELL